MIKAADLYQELKIIEENVRNKENPDGSCRFDADKVYVLLETALHFVNEPEKHD